MCERIVEITSTADAYERKHDSEKLTRKMDSCRVVRIKLNAGKSLESNQSIFDQYLVLTVQIRLITRNFSNDS